MRETREFALRVRQICEIHVLLGAKKKCFTEAVAGRQRSEHKEKTMQMRTRKGPRRLTAKASPTAAKNLGGAREEN